MEKLQLNNYMEDLLMDVLPKVLKKMDICKCEHCRLDIAAFALNKLPPKYVVTHAGEMYTRLVTLHQQFDADVVSAITQGAELVSRQPRHDE